MPGWHIACGTSQLLLNDLSKNGQVSRAELSSLVELQHDHCFAGQRSLRVQTAKCTSTHASFFALFCGASEIQAAPWMTVCGWQDVKLQWPTLLMRFLRRHAWPQPCSVYCKLGRPDAPTLWLFRQAVPGRVALSGHLTFLSDTWRWYQTPDILHSCARVWMSSFNTPGNATRRSCVSTIHWSHCVDSRRHLLDLPLSAFHCEGHWVHFIWPTFTNLNFSKSSNWLACVSD